MFVPETFDATYIAPCGINCGTCMAFLRSKNRCEGCRTTGIQKARHCLSCSILHCELLAQTHTKFCSECIKFPCRRMKDMEKRYSTRYRLSLSENLQMIQQSGINSFIQSEKVKWKCPECGGTLCVHRDFCVQCTSRKAKNPSVQE